MRAAIAVMLGAAAFGMASAQNSGGMPAPSPSPSPSPNPAPEQFHSPFGGPDKPSDSIEAQAFNSLMELYDAMEDARARLKFAGKCGSASDVADAYDALQAATDAFETALTEYILDNSGVIYPRKGLVRQQLNDRYEADKKAVLDALSKRDKKQHPVGDCPNQTQKVEQGPGGDGGRPPDEHSGFWDHFSVGVGVGVGGGGDRRHDDRGSTHDTQPQSDTPHD